MPNRVANSRPNPDQAARKCPPCPGSTNRAGRVRPRCCHRGGNTISGGPAIGDLHIEPHVVKATTDAAQASAVRGSFLEKLDDTSFKSRLKVSDIVNRRQRCWIDGIQPAPSRQVTALTEGLISIGSDLHGLTFVTLAYIEYTTSEVVIARSQLHIAPRKTPLRRSRRHRGGRRLGRGAYFIKRMSSSTRASTSHSLNREMESA